MSPALSLRENKTAATENRRRRGRLKGETQGWILSPTSRLANHMPSEDEAWEVRIANVSRFGIGFISTERFRLGEEHRIRIGRGPMKRARLVRIVSCRQIEHQLFNIGAEFVDTSRRTFAKAG